MGHVLPTLIVETNNSASDGTIINIVAVIGEVFGGVLVAIPFIVLGVVTVLL